MQNKACFLFSAVYIVNIVYQASVTSPDVISAEGATVANPEVERSACGLFTLCSTQHSSAFPPLSSPLVGALTQCSGISGTSCKQHGSVRLPSGDRVEPRTRGQRTPEKPSFRTLRPGSLSCARPERVALVGDTRGPWGLAPSRQDARTGSSRRAER